MADSRGHVHHPVLPLSSPLVAVIYEVYYFLGSQMFLRNCQFHPHLTSSQTNFSFQSYGKIANVK